jgi:RNA polymerase sigma-54 factor
MAIQAKQTTQQRLMLAPNITLALEILRMPLMELQAFLEHQVEENPVLELDQEENDDEPPQPDEAGQDEPFQNGIDLDEEWSAHWRGAEGVEQPDDEDHRPEDWRVDHRLQAPQSLPEWLKIQIACQPITKEQQGLGELLIERLDENGYLDDALDDVADATGIPVDQLEAVLRIIQRLDPPGVGARNLRECLLIQLDHQGGSGTLAHRILTDHFQLFVQHRFVSIAKATGSSPQEVDEACSHLKRLNPKPGSAYSGKLPPSIVPDLIIHHRENHYDVELNDHELPRISISRAYYRMLKNPDTPADAKEFLSMRLRQAGWLIKAIDERNTTLLSIARCLISLQRDFLEQGAKSLKPLTQAQVAGLVGRHPSTVSRAIAGKTIDTPYGVFRLEELFASGVPQRSGEGNGSAESVSDERIKSEIRRFVEEEDPRHCLSDAAIARRLAERNISVARRTIAKYRASLNLLPAHLRRRAT